ncbi:gamma-glutamyl-gamma-aminobutyrate hydrolase family protein [bacterium]|nr:gamma-glutamyl-gamma-aminobutyrate hydrolase family protein [bacterium]
MHRPLIGLISGYAPPDKSRKFSQGNSINSVELNYSLCIEKGGGLPVLIPYIKEDEGLTQFCSQLDGLLLVGGDDVDPARYDQEMLPTKYPPVPERDTFEERFLKHFLQTGKPVLGICRGIQLLNVHFGGSLIQDLPHQMSIVHHMQEAGSSLIAHMVTVKPDSLIARLLGPEPIEVNSFHHQCVDRIGDGLKAVGYSEEGIVEVIEHESHPFCLAVQWHPERMQYDERQMKLFSGFVEATRGGKNG